MLRPETSTSVEPAGRVIDLGASFEAPDSRYDFFCEKKSGETVTTRWRIGNRLFTKRVTQTYGDKRSKLVVEESEEDARVDYREIHKAAEVVADRDASETPWEHCDGWEHTIADFSQWLSARDGLPALTYDEARTHFRAQRGYVSYSDVLGDGAVVIIPDYDCLSGPEYYHNKGCSKQVAFELAAYEKRRMLNQLVHWYRHGWEWYGVKCEYEGYEASVWGIDDERYATEDVTHDEASSVAWQMEKDGYKITHRPRGPKRGTSGYTRQGYLDHLRRQMQWYGTVGDEGGS